MRKFPFLPTSAIAAGFVSAWLIHFALPADKAGLLSRLHRAVESGHHAVAVSGLETAAQSAAQSFAPEAMPESESRIGVVLLSEPMLILRGSHYSGLKLPRGTRLDVLEDNGHYLRVRYADSVVTIPRSVTIKSVSAAFDPVRKS
jgi:hypothetical protein